MRLFSSARPSQSAQGTSADAPYSSKTVETRNRDDQHIFAAGLPSAYPIIKQQKSAAEVKRAKREEKKRLKKGEKLIPAKPWLAEPTGRLTYFPQIDGGEELVNRAIKRARQVPLDKDIFGAKARARKRATQQAVELGQTVSIGLRDVVHRHSLEWLRRSLHPFEHATAILSARHRERSGGAPLATIVKEVQELRKSCLNAAKDGAFKAKHAESIEAAALAYEETVEDLKGRVKEREHWLKELRAVQRIWRRLPVVDLNAPTVVLVGAPNVGKSTLVRELSSGEPTVGNYAFTTRGVTMGHLELDVDRDDGLPLRGQVMDTPGLLWRGRSYDLEMGSSSSSNSETSSSSSNGADASAQKSSGDHTTMMQPRNAMEELTLAALRYLPAAVVFVFDLSGHAGDRTAACADQLKVRDALRAQFPKRPWIDVVAKADLFFAERQRYLDHADQADQLLKPPADAIFVSARTREGIDQLEARIHDLLLQVRPVAAAYYAAAQRRPVTAATTQAAARAAAAARETASSSHGENGERDGPATTATAATTDGAKGTSQEHA